MMYLSLLSDVLLIAATGGMALWCRTLARRLRKLDDVEARESETPADMSEIRASIAALATQVEALKAAVATARFEIDERGDRMKDQLVEADDRIGHMEMLLASYEDVEAQTAAHAMDAPRVPEPAPAPEPARASESTAPLMPSFRARKAGAA
ncbi:hypothetical protein [uncultured Jannaschia sp.]|uniref:hypothetical protein n=1 Tax=uncultured Jannaschia sp. TaxID=293347 RepID=UPI002601BF72|nr:hypothetical protein [uncultured Jannaschia sp.]